MKLHDTSVPCAKANAPDDDNNIGNQNSAVLNKTVVSASVSKTCRPRRVVASIKLLENNWFVVYRGNQIQHRRALLNKHRQVEFCSNMFVNASVTFCSNVMVRPHHTHDTVKFVFELQYMRMVFV